MAVAGIDYSTRAVDVVLLDEDSDAASWVRFELEGQDAFERARSVRDPDRLVRHAAQSWMWDDVVAVGIEDPRGYNAGALYRVQGAILACIPRDKLVQPWIPSAWRKAVGLPGNASKEHVRQYLVGDKRPDWPQDACDAYGIALATRTLLQYEAVA